MAARRLVIAMIGLLIVSTVVAALVPNASREQGPTTETTAEETGPDGGASGNVVRRQLDASAPRPDTISLDRGDQLVLKVEAIGPGQVEIADLGLVQDVSRDDPALFDLLLDQTGNYPVRMVEPRESIGRIEVRPEARPGSESGRGSARPGSRAAGGHGRSAPRP